MPLVSRLVTDITPLRESRQFRRLWVGTTLSAVGGALTMFALPLQVYDITHSSFAVGAIGIATLVPTLAVGLLGGAFADAVDRRKLVLVTNVCLAVVSAALAGQAFAGVSALWLLYVLAALAAALSAVSEPARRTLVPALLRPDQLAAGLALNRVTFQVMLTVGPALAGVITGAAGGHLQACYLLDALSFAGSVYGVARLPPMAPQAGAARPGPRAIAQAMGFLRRSPVLAGALLADLNATIFGMPVALFPAINAERFGGNPTTLGLFTTAIGAGGLVSAAFTGPVARTARQGAVMLSTVAIWGAAFAGFALAHTLWLVLGTLAIAGAADTFTVVLRSTIVQTVTTDELRGRVTAAEYVFGIGGSSLGGLESGAVGSLTSPTISALSGGIVTVVLAGALAVAMPSFARYRSESATTSEVTGSLSSAAAEPTSQET